MTSTTLWGRTSSINVRKVMLALHETQQPYERIDAGLEYGIVSTPHYLAKNPNALVPVLEDDGAVLWESNVIVRYVCERYSHDGLYPADRAARYEAEKWMDWQQTTLNRACGSGFIQLVRTPKDRQDPAIIARSWEETDKCFATLEALLAGRPFAAGDRYTMADIPLAVEMHRWMGLPWQHPSRPFLQAWYERVTSRPAARGVLDVQLV